MEGNTIDVLIRKLDMAGLQVKYSVMIYLNEI